MAPYFLCFIILKPDIIFTEIGIVKNINKLKIEAYFVKQNYI